MKGLEGNAPDWSIHCVDTLDCEAQRQEPLGKGCAPSLLAPKQDEAEATQRAHGLKVKWSQIKVHKDAVDVPFGNETGIEAHGDDAFGDFGIWAVR